MRIRNKKLLFGGIMVMVTLLTILIVAFSGLFALAETSIFSPNSEFFSDTNTYNVKEMKTQSITEGDVKIEYKLPVYDFDAKNDNIVSDDDPQVTFVTHGLNGDASHWSNGYLAF